MHTLRRIFNVIKNKYFIAIIVFFALMLFYDKNDVFVQLDRQKQLKELKGSQQFYEKEIGRLQQQLTDLETNPESLQKYARENLFMKKANEDIFIVESPADSSQQN